jgi:hypothetical protein
MDRVPAWAPLAMPAAIAVRASGRTQRDTKDLIIEHSRMVVF